MQRVRHRGRHRRVAARRGQPALGEHGRIVAVDQVVRDAGMVRLLQVDRLEDCRRLELLGIGLVGGQRRGVEGQRVEHAGLAVVRVGRVDPRHRLLVGEAARAVIELVPVPVERRAGTDIVPLALGLGADGLGPRHRLGTRFEGALAGRVPERVPVAHRHAPVAHGTGRVGLGHPGERLDRLLVPERVQDRDRTVQLLLRRRGAGGREMHLAERSTARVGVLLAGHRRSRQKYQARAARQGRHPVPDQPAHRHLLHDLVDARRMRACASQRQATLSVLSASPQINADGRSRLFQESE